MIGAKIRLTVRKPPNPYRKPIDERENIEEFKLITQREINPPTIAPLNLPLTVRLE